MAGLTGLAVRIGADITGYRKGMDEVTGKARQVAKEIPAALAVASAAVIALGGFAVDAGAKFEAGMKKIRTGTGATGDALKALGDDARAVFRQVPEDFETVAGVVADLNTRLGLTGAPLQSMTKKMLDLARVSSEQVEPLTVAVTRAFGDWNVPTEKQSALLDTLFKTSQQTGIGVGKLAETVVQFGAPLRNLGFSMEETIALFGKWEKEGVNTTTVMSGMKQAVGNFAQAGINARDGLESLIHTINTESDEAAKNAAIKVVGKEAANDFFDAVRGGKFDLDALITSTRESGETIAKAADESKTSGEKMAEAWNKVIDALMPVGEAILGVTAFLVDGLAPALELLGPLLTTIIGGLERLFSESQKGMEQYYEWLGLGQTAASQQKIITELYEENARVIRERIVLLKQRNAAEADVVRQLENLALTGVKLTKEEQEALAVAREREAKEAAKAAALKKTGEAAQKTHVDLSKLGQKEKELIPTTEQLGQSWGDLEKQLKLDMAATGKFNTVLVNHRSNVEPLILSYKKWGMELPPLLADAQKLYDKLDEADRQYEELLNKIERVTAGLREQGDEAVDASADWQQLTDKLKGATGEVEDFDFGEVDWEQVAPPKSFFDRLGGAMGDAFAEGFGQAFRNSGDLKQAVSVGLAEAIDVGLTMSLGKLGTNPIVSSLTAVLGGSIGNWLGSALFGEKLTNEQLAKGYGEAFGKEFGLAFNKEFEAALMQAASRIPEVRGRIDASVARFMPEMISHILEQIDSLTPQIQASLAESIGHGVNYLMEKGGLSHKKAFEAFLPQFGEIIRQAIAGGQALDQGILNLIEHAKNLGVDFSELGSTFAAALEELISGAEISAEELRNLADIAASVGIDIQDVFADALEDFIESEEFSIEKLEDLARAARAAGLAVGDVLADALAEARQELKDLQEDALNIGRSLLDAFLRKIELKGGMQRARQGYVDERVSGAEDEFDRQNADRLKSIREIRDENERAAAEAAYEQDREAAAAQEREEAQKRFEELKKKARAIDIDGKNDARDIREAIKGLSPEEAKIVIELAKQKQERIAAREEIKRQRRAQKLANDQIEAQNRLVEALEALFKNLNGPMAENETKAEGFAGWLGVAKNWWQYMYEHPLDLPKTEGDGSGGGGQGGTAVFNAGFGGTGVFQAGFGGGSVPTAQYGLQSFSAPSAPAGGGVPLIVAPVINISAIDAKSLRERGVDISAAVEAATKRGLTGLNPNILKG